MAADEAGAAGNQNAHTLDPAPAASRRAASLQGKRLESDTQSKGRSVVNRLRKAVFPVAGLGTRFLPATKAMPKEMLTIVDRPALQYVVDEAREAGIESFIFVTGRNKEVIDDHFDIAYELEATLAARGKTAELEALRRERPKAGTVSYTRQQEPLGLGHAVWCARELVGREPFAVLLPDMLMNPGLPDADAGGLRQAWRQRHRGRGSARRPGEPLWHRRRRRGGRDRLPDHQHGREAEARGRALQPLSSRAATSCSRRSSTCSTTRSQARAEKSRSPTR